MRICFVCLGNICRSPTAEGVFLKFLSEAGTGDEVAVDSAGTGGWHAGEKADPRSRAAASRRGYDLPSRARKVVVADFANFDLILAMDRENLESLREMADSDEKKDRVRLFRSFDPSAGPNAEVPDPYYGGENGFEEVLDMCERASQGLLAHIKQQRG